MSHLPINTRITLVLGALTRVNEIRAEFGYRELDALPCGYSEGECCPVALGLTVGSLRATVTGSVDCTSEILVHDSAGSAAGVQYTEEAAIGAFVEAFDSGQLPEYQVPQDGY